jgi:cytochrome c-type biogenesis protein CcmH
MMIVLLLMLQLKVPDAANFVGQPKGAPITSVQLSQRTEEVAGLLRCPVCQGMAVADSKSEMAVNMKAQVSELLARGYTEAQILQYFELSYGQFVLLRPKFQGFTAAVWLLPVLGLLVGVAVLFFTLQKLGRRPLPATDPQPLPTESDPYLARVRDLVVGDKP